MESWKLEDLNVFATPLTSSPKVNIWVSSKGETFYQKKKYYNVNYNHIGLPLISLSGINLCLDTDIRKVVINSKTEEFSKLPQNFVANSILIHQLKSLKVLVGPSEVRATSGAT